MNIAFITREIEGLDKNGGIGTATRYICEHLAHTGNHEIHIYHTGSPSGDTKSLKNQMKSLGIALHYIHSDAKVAYFLEGRPYQTYLALRETNHDVYIFHDYYADGLFCFLAKESGAAFKNVKLGLVIHSSSCWLDQANQRFPESTERLSLYDMEQTCGELADFLVSPSEYLLEWAKEEGWNLPKNSRCIPYLVSPPEKSESVFPRIPVDVADIRELVFFGRLEERKGVRVFCEALNQLPAEILAGRTITFLGKVGGYHCDYIRQILQPALLKAACSLKFHTQLGSLAARDYLKQQRCLAIIPSLTDNSPCVIYECLENGVAFFASAAGGGKELIHKDDREYITFEPNKNALAALIIRGFNTKLIPLARPSYSIDGIVCKWEELFAELQDQPSSSQYSPMDCDKKTPLVSLILVHHNRHRLLEISLQSCLEQDYPNLEIILVDDGSTEPESLAYLDDLERTNRQDPRLRILRCENRYLGAARNAGVKVASGEYVVFLDDDNIALPNMVSRYVAAVLHSGADAVSGAMRYFYEQDGRPNIKASNNPIYVFWGGRQRYSAMLTNHLGDATGIYRKEIVIKAGGFHENFGVTHEDWKMYADIERLGGRIVTIPDMMYWYRVTSGSMIKSTKQYLNAQMHLLPYAQRLPRNFAHLPFVLFAILNNQDIYSSGYCHPVYWQYTIQFARIIRRFPRFEKMVVRILETSYPMLKRCFHSLRQWYHRTKT